MKKAILALAALMLTASGVAAVSAYEAHLINVKAHVENAMSVTEQHLDFGTVFPEEWVLKEFTVQVSGSFCNELQTRVTYIDYAVYAEWKPNPAGGFYPWLGDALYLGIDAVNKKPVAAGGNLVPVGGPPVGTPGTVAKKIMDAPLPLHKFAPYNMDDKITIGLDTPVFEGYYNEITDKLWQAEYNTTKPSGLNVPTVVIGTQDPRWNPSGIDLGIDIKIQVIWIGTTPAPVP